MKYIKKGIPEGIIKLLVSNYIDDCPPLTLEMREKVLEKFLRKIKYPFSEESIQNLSGSEKIDVINFFLDNTEFINNEKNFNI